MRYAAADSPTIPFGPPPRRREARLRLQLREHAGPRHAEQHELARSSTRVARPQRALLALHAVDGHPALPDVLDLEPSPTKRTRSWRSEDGALEDAFARVDRGDLAGPLANELHELLELGVPAADEEPLPEGEERDLAHAVRLGRGPRDDEREAGLLVRVLAGGGRVQVPSSFRCSCSSPLFRWSANEQAPAGIAAAGLHVDNPQPSELLDVAQEGAGQPRAVFAAEGRRGGRRREARGLQVLVEGVGCRPVGAAVAGEVNPSGARREHAVVQRHLAPVAARRAGAPRRPEPGRRWAPRAGSWSPRRRRPSA